MSNTVKILGVGGSLRKESWSKKLMHSTADLLPENASIAFADFSDLPMFSEDIENPLPESVVAFKKQIEEADAVLFVTPEYNFSVPGYLKNALDWATRPYGANIWEGKPAAIASSSVGPLGGSRATYLLRQILVNLGMPTVQKPEVFVGSVQDQFDADGNLTNEDTKKFFKQELQALVDLTLQLKK